MSSSGRSDMVQAALTLSWRQAKSLCFCPWPCLLLVSMTWKRQLAFSKEGVALKPYVFSSLFNINSRFFSNGLISNTGNLDLLRSQLIVRSLTFFFFFFLTLIRVKTGLLLLIRTCAACLASVWHVAVTFMVQAPSLGRLDVSAVSAALPFHEHLA